MPAKPTPPRPPQAGGPSISWTDTNTDANAVLEGAANGTLVGITANAMSSGKQTFTYSLSDDAAGRFSIDPMTGVITINNGGLINYEAASSYTIAVKAQAGGITSTQTFSIAINNVAPTWSQNPDSDVTPNAVTEGAATGTFVGITASAIDINGGKITYGLSNDADGAYQIDSNTGIVSVKDGSRIDYETTSDHHQKITVSASDGTSNIFRDYDVSIIDAPPNIVNVVHGQSYSATSGEDYFVFDFSEGMEGNTANQTPRGTISNFDPDMDKVIFENSGFIINGPTFGSSSTGSDYVYFNGKGQIPGGSAYGEFDELDGNYLVSASEVISSNGIYEFYQTQTYLQMNENSKSLDIHQIFENNIIITDGNFEI
jgi:hypothetical protein